MQDPVAVCPSMCLCDKLVACSGCKPAFGQTQLSLAPANSQTVQCSVVQSGTRCVSDGKWMNGVPPAGERDILLLDIAEENLGTCQTVCEKSEWQVIWYFSTAIASKHS